MNRIVSIGAFCKCINDMYTHTQAFSPWPPSLVPPLENLLILHHSIGHYRALKSATKKSEIWDGKVSATSTTIG